MDALPWILALPACAGLAALALPSRRLAAVGIALALGLHLLVLSPALVSGGVDPLLDPALGAEAWLALAPPPGASWVPLLLCLLATLSGSSERVGAGGSAWASLGAAACFLAAASPLPRVGLGALLVANLCAIAAAQSGSARGAPHELGVGSALAFALVAALASGLVSLGPQLAGSPRAQAVLCALLLGLPLAALTRQPARFARAPGLLLCGASFLATLGWLGSQGFRAAGLGWVALAIALGAALEAWTATRIDRAQVGLWGAGLSLGAAGWAWGGGATLAAALCFWLATFSLSADSMARACGGWEVESWRGLRRLAPGASAALILACAGSILPGGLLARSLYLEDPLLAWCLALAAVPLAAGLLRIAFRVVRGAGALPGRGTRRHPAWLPAAFAAGLGLLLAGPEPRFSAPAALAAALALGLALACGQRPLGWIPGPAARLWGGALLRLEPYAPQRRLVQPLLGQARRAAELEPRWFERFVVAGALARLAALATRPPALLTKLQERSAAPPIASGRRVGAEVTLLVAGLLLAAYLLG